MAVAEAISCCFASATVAATSIHAFNALRCPTARRDETAAASLCRASSNSSEDARHVIHAAASSRLIMNDTPRRAVASCSEVCSHHSSHALQERATD